MSEFFFLSESASERLAAWNAPSDFQEARTWCPNGGNHRFHNGTLMQSDPVNAAVNAEVKHNKADELMIWNRPPMRCLVHDDLAAEFASQGFTGFTFRPATVRFRNGALSTRYRRLLPTGWGGTARPESGLRLVEKCSACLQRVYSRLTDAGQVIDRKQWSGEDFFIVWPLPMYIFITSRVKDFLEKNHVCSYYAHSLAQETPIYTGPAVWVGSLAEYLPEELALRYGKPIGIV